VLQKNAQGIPILIEKCIEYIEEKTIKLEGIFRVSAMGDILLDLKRQADEGKTDFSHVDPIVNPEAMANLLKSYLRELPTSIIELSNTDRKILLDMISAAAVEKDQKQTIKSFLRKIPPTNYIVLKRLCIFLKKK